MKNADNQKLEELLESRPFIPARNNLANRIAKAARLMSQKKDESIGEWLQGLFWEFIVIKPAYTSGLILALGLCIGFVSTSQNIDKHSDGIYANQIQGFLYVKRSFL